MTSPASTNATAVGTRNGSPRCRARNHSLLSLDRQIIHRGSRPCGNSGIQHPIHRAVTSACCPAGSFARAGPGVPVARATVPPLRIAASNSGPVARSRRYASRPSPIASQTPVRTPTGTAAQDRAGTSSRSPRYATSTGGAAVAVTSSSTTST